MKGPREDLHSPCFVLQSLSASEQGWSKARLDPSSPVYIGSLAVFVLLDMVGQEKDASYRKKEWWRLPVPPNPQGVPAEESKAAPAWQA